MGGRGMTGDLCVNGEWQSASGAGFASIDPALGDVVWSGRAAGAGEVRQAFVAAQKAFPDWARAPVAERVAACRAFGVQLEAQKEQFAIQIARETGKPLWEARTEVQAMLGKIEISIRARDERAGERSDAAAFGESRLHHRPHGVLGVMGPYNFPGHLPNGHIIPALLAGNSLVFKPSELTPGTGAAMMELWREAGLPAGVLNLVQGGRETGAALLADPALAGVLFTGSAATGRLIHRQFAGRPEIILALEMGGNNPLLVWPAADPGIAANLIVHSAFATSGQRCSCARRLILPKGVFGDAVLEALILLASHLSIGPWNASPEPFLGPLVSIGAAQRALAGAQALIAAGAKPLLPMRCEGAFFHPLLMDMTDAQEPEDEEIFAPVLQIWRVADLDQAIARANASRFGLSGGVISADPAVWARAQGEMRAGVLNWNRPTTGASSSMPFGGPGLSGNARPSAYYAADYCAFPLAMQIAPVMQAISAPGLTLP